MTSDEGPGSKSPNPGADFTLKAYRRHLTVGLRRFRPRTFTDFEGSERFMLLRHDVDISLNRALKMARVEHELGIVSTYLVDPHSPFYNIAEHGQRKLLKEILALGHALGLHFDPNFAPIESEEHLDAAVANEASWLEFLCGDQPEAVSFHNPTELHLGWRAERYGGLVNCYSARIMGSVTYISDSNGYWRFRALEEVLADDSTASIQVLTHPVWWQDAIMAPRQRVARSVFGRSKTTLNSYDRMLAQMHRNNIDDRPDSLVWLCNHLPDRGSLIDLMWQEERFESLFEELRRLHADQVERLPYPEVARRTSALPISADTTLLDRLGGSAADASRSSESEQDRWRQTARRSALHSEGTPATSYRDGCVFLSGVIYELAEWGVHSQGVGDGLS